MTAGIACMRKLVTLLNAILKSQTPWKTQYEIDKQDSRYQPCRVGNLPKARRSFSEAGLPTILPAWLLSFGHVLRWWAKRLRQLAHPTRLNDKPNHSPESNVLNLGWPCGSARVSVTDDIFGKDKEQWPDHNYVPPSK
jgi:hypothetical protein